MVPSAFLRDVANAVERFEKSDDAMRRGWPVPADAMIREWNDARRVADRMLAQLRREIGR